MSKSAVEISNQALERLSDLQHAVWKGDKAKSTRMLGVIDGLITALAIICEEGE